MSVRERCNAERHSASIPLLERRGMNGDTTPLFQSNFKMPPYFISWIWCTLARMAAILQHTPVDLPDFLGCRALFTNADDVDTAIFFVHGFNGHPRNTWIDFHGLIDVFVQSYPHWGRSDAYFFSYPSVYQHLVKSADDFCRFLKKYYPRPRAPWIGRDQWPSLRHGKTTYTKLVLVGHSEGAVVIRLCISDVVKEYVLAVGMCQEDPRGHDTLVGSKISTEDRHSITVAEGILQGELRLFAPAIMGAVQSRLIGTLTGWPGIGAFVRTFLQSSPARNEMQPETLIMRQLIDETVKAADKWKGMTALRALILWGAKDSIVQMGEYKCDTRVGIVPGHDHFSICKPTMAYRKPLGFVQHGSSAAAST